MASNEFIGLIFTGLSISISIIYYANVLRNQNETRKTQLFMQLHQSKYEQKGLESMYTLMNLKWDDFEDYLEKYGGITGHIETASAFTSWVEYYDGIGLLAKEKKIDLETVYNITHSRILFIWFKFETVIKGLREGPWGVPDYLDNFENLANMMIKMRIKKGLPIPYTSYIHPKSELYKEYNP
jgi:hypothetical protein